MDDDKNNRPSLLNATLALIYNQGGFKQPQLFPTKEENRNAIKFRKLIDKEAKKRNAEPYELIDYFADHRKELIDLLEKKDITSTKFSKIYQHAEMEKIKSQILKPGKLTKTGRITINEDYIKGEVEVWKAKDVEYFIKVEDTLKLGDKNPKVFVSQLKNISLLMGLIQEQQFNNPIKEAKCKFMLSYYAERRGYTKEEIKRGGIIFEELKRDLLTGALTAYSINNKEIINGNEYIRHGISSFYDLLEPIKDHSGIDWIIEFKSIWRNWILEILNGNASQYFVEERKAIEDRHTTENPYLFLFYRQLIKRKRANLFTQPIKVINLLRDMKLPDKILARPGECFKLLRKGLIYFSEHYQPVPELESFKLYNDYHKTKTLPLPIAISRAFKDYEYEDFKDLIKSMGLKDIREAYISFKRPHKKAGHKLNKEENELLARVLNWFEGQITKIPYRDQESLIKNYIIKLGHDRFKRLYEIEANNHNANAVDFLTRVLPGKKKDKIEADNKSHISGMSANILNDFPDR